MTKVRRAPGVERNAKDATVIDNAPGLATVPDRPYQPRGRVGLTKEDRGSPARIRASRPILPRACKRGTKPQETEPLSDIRLRPSRDQHTRVSILRTANVGHPHRKRPLGAAKVRSRQHKKLKASDRPLYSKPEDVAIKRTTKTKPPSVKAVSTKQIKASARQVRPIPIDQRLHSPELGIYKRLRSSGPVATGSVRNNLQPESQHRRGIATTEHPQLQNGRGRLQSATAAWVARVESISPERVHRAQPLYGSRVPSEGDESEDNMESSSLSTNREDDVSTLRGTATKGHKVSEDKLRVRGVLREATTDQRMQHLLSILKTELPDRALKDTEDVLSVAREFIRQNEHHPDESCYPYLDDLSFKIDEGKAKIGYPILNRKYFEADLKRCLARNEAVLQRTIMINIVNQYWLAKIFDWNCEGQWIVPCDTRLPSREEDKISVPKPDLALSFTLQSFTGPVDSDPIPMELKKCISPDGGNRCFPFLFMEVKKAATDLQEAYMANLHNASQALYNIYLWMVRAQQKKAFFDTVRVFSLVFNAQDLCVRVHRAVELANGQLNFHFHEFWPLKRYTKDEACVLIKTILTDYAAEELHRELKSTFTEVVRQEDARIITKRKANAERGNSSKRTRQSQDGNGNHVG